MSLDKPRSRSDISTEIKSRESDKQKRLRETRKTLIEKQTEAKVARKLRLAGTTEGVHAIKTSFGRIVEATDHHFDGQKSDLEKKVFAPAKGLEKNLHQRSGETARDKTELTTAGRVIETKAARQELVETEKKVKEDQGFLDNAQKTQESDRRKGETEAEKQKAEIKGTRVSFRV
jgi:hypothetical protein